MAFSRRNPLRAPRPRCKQCKKNPAQPGKELCTNCKQVSDEFAAKMQTHAAK
jgi:hypothetical protein